MIRAPASLSAAAASALADMRKVATACTDWTSPEALARADAAAARAVETLRHLRMQTRAVIAEERKRRRDKAEARERAQRRNAEIFERRRA